MTETAPLTELRSNLPEYSVGEISALLKRTVEENFSYVRVRGEISGLKRHSSGHCYLCLKDTEAVLDAVIWRQTMMRLGLKPEDGMEVVCAGRLTTYPGRSKYQLVIESVELAGIGALLKLLEARKKKLEAEGLFADGRKRKLPYLPAIIGVVTSPSGAVIRDILHRLDDRFPRRVLVWPVAVQGEGAAAQIAAAIEGFNALVPGAPVPRPDLLIVARGGGSLEDLMAFNEEIVVRAAAASRIPLISAVGHETDTTLIDFASDRRAPTPTAAAEMAVPVRLELIAEIAGKSVRLANALSRGLNEQRTHLAGLARGLPDPASLIGAAAQKLDDRAERLGNGLTQLLRLREQQLKTGAARLRPLLLKTELAQLRRRLDDLLPRLHDGKERFLARQLALIESAGARLHSFYRALEQQLERGYAIVRAKGHIVTAADQVLPGAALTIEFHDGTVVATAEGASRKRKRTTDSTSQGKLLGLALFLALAVAGPVRAGTLVLEGTVEQGGLVRGQVDPGAQVSLDGKPVRVAPDGRFIFGFGRDAPSAAVLDVVFADGSRMHRNLTVDARHWDIRRLEGLPPEQVTPDPALVARINSENKKVAEARATDSDALFFEAPLAWPALGRISGIYGSQSVMNGEPRQPHYGVDVAAPPGSPVLAAASGIVTLAEPDFFLTGGTIVIDHGYGLSTTYMHMASLLVHVGDEVAARDPIGTVGATGRVTGPHLDWRVNWYQVRLDPQRVAGPMPTSSLPPQANDGKGGG
jgi:exodeoxyribonuclease VII large subunit